jgi:minor extracellular serine protease Vpr
VFSSRVGGPTGPRRASSRKVWSAVFVAAIAGLSIVSAASGDGGNDDGITAAPARFAKIDASLLANAVKGFNPASLNTTEVSVMLQLGDKPVAVREAEAKKSGGDLSTAEKDAIRQQLKSKQDNLTGSIEGAGGQIVGQLQSAYNGISVVVPQSSLGQLAALPGVVAVRAVRTFTPSNERGAAYIQVPQAWQSSGKTGLGVKVAVIDTGIDYTHASFGGPGTAAAWADAQAHSTVAQPAWVGPAAPKVRGGWDFVGDAYNADSKDPAKSTPHPDPNPLDCNGHGSHTAGTAAGDGVRGGLTYSGPYNASTPSTGWNVAPGMAPQALIYAYRVFGCSGSSNIVDLAIDQAVKDNVDVISMSLGSSLGGINDPTTVAAENAAGAGITLVASAGNDGGGAYVTGSPATGSHVLSVAAVDASFPQYPGATLTLTTKAGTPGGTVDTIVANGVSLPSGSFKVKVLKTASGAISLGCSQAEYAGTAGMVVVTKRGTCPRVDRATFGQAENAAAVVMVNTDSGLPPYEGPISGVTIPFLGAGSGAETALVGADGGTVTMAGSVIQNPGYGSIASFSSGGPRNPDSAPKPDVTAPGVSVSSVAVGSGTGAAFISGTSMAAPMAAGVAALVKQAHPSWKGDLIRAVIQNTADKAKVTPYNVRRAGAGVVNADRAVNATVVATTGDGLNSLAFGYVPGTGNYTAEKTFTLTNTGTSSATYGLTIDPNGGQLGSSIVPDPSSVTLAPGESKSVTARLTIPAAAFAALPSVSSFAPAPPAAGQGGVLTIRGAIVATPQSPAAGQYPVRLAYLVAPRGVSNVVAGTPSPFGKSGATLPLTNNGIHAGTADLYAWGITDANENGQGMDVRDVGVQVLPGPTLQGGTAADRSLVFVINTWGRTANQSGNEFDISIDVNRDGVADYLVVGADLGLVLNGAVNGIYASFIFDAAGNLIDAWNVDAPMNGSLIELPTLASEIGLATQANGQNVQNEEKLTYQVNSYDLVNGGTDTTATSGVFAPFQPAVSSGDFATVAPGGTASMPLSVHGNSNKPGVLGWLVASVDDANGAPQADEVKYPASTRK